MYEVVKNVIRSGSYDLTAILAKIDVLWVRGSLTEEQRRTLAEAARSNASARNSVDVLAKLAELDGRIRALEGQEESAETEEYPAYVAGKWYYAGDRCSENGVNYVCIAPEGQVCTWSPAEYPAYWEAG